MNDVINNIKAKFGNISFDNDKRRKFVLVIGILGILLILISEIELPFHKNDSKHSADFDGDYSEYVNTLNDELTEVLTNIYGVGNCVVMITLKSTKENIYAQNTENSFSDSSNSKNNEYVIYESENGDSPILLKENFPAVEGVAVVCSGGDVPAVKEKVIDCVCALFHLTANRVSVSKLNDKG